MIRAIAMICLCASTALADAPLRITGPARVIDGDTLRVEGVTVRLSGIDAPELRQTCQLDANTTWLCGQDAAKMLRELVEDGVTCHLEGRDRYGRALATCYRGEYDIGADMVRDGFALAYRRYSARYVPEEESARERKVGLWLSDFIPPWEWRRQM
jgi:endonuclease YncB( thermonuclease family)